MQYTFFAYGEQRHTLGRIAQFVSAVSLFTESQLMEQKAMKQQEVVEQQEVSEQQEAVELSVQIVPRRPPKTPKAILLQLPCQQVYDSEDRRFRRSRRVMRRLHSPSRHVISSALHSTNIAKSTSTEEPASSSFLNRTNISLNQQPHH